MTLYETLGGPGKADGAIAAVVDRFYVRMMADPFVSRFFAGIDMEKQRKKQTQFVTMAFGGPNDYQYRDMDAAHKHLREKLGMTDEHFDRVKKHLGDTMLEEFNIPQNLVDDAMAIVETTREAVMGRVGKAKAGGGARSKGSDMSALLWATGVGAVATAVFTSIFLRPSK